MSPKARLEGKVAIITGSASGIGRATAELFARHGAAVVIADRNREGAEAVAALIREHHGHAISQWVDVSDEDAVHAMVEAAVSHFGRLDILHNNAALTTSADTAHDGAIADLDMETFDRSIQVNLRGVVLGCKHAIPRMIQCGGGSIVNTTSNISLAGDLSLTAYAAAKGGVNALTRCVATQYGGMGIRCNAVSPGMILTENSRASVPAEVLAAIEGSNLVPRLGAPDDIAHAVLFLASDESAFVTGQILSIDGGQLAHLPHYAALRSTGLPLTR